MAHESRLTNPVEEPNDDGLRLREEDATYFVAHPDERYYLRDVFADERHPFLVDAHELRSEIPHPTLVKIVAIRFRNPRVVARVPVLQRTDKPSQLFISRADEESNVYLRQGYTIDQLMGKLINGFKKTLLLRGMVYDGKCCDCGLSFRTGDMVGGHDTGADVLLYCCYCMERRLLNHNKIDAAVIAIIDGDDIGDEEKARATKVIDEIIARIRPLLAEGSRLYDIGKNLRSTR